MSDNTITIRTGPLIRAQISLADSYLSIKYNAPNSKPPRHHSVSFRHLLQAEFESSSRKVTIAYIEKKNKKKGYHLVVVEGAIDEPHVQHAAQWVETVMKAAYDDFGIKRRRRLMVFVNPFGGTKKGAQIFAQKVEPIFKIAGCSTEVLYTTHSGQAQEVAKTLPLHFDAIITVSGDGLVHEVLNGFSEHADPIGAFSIPIGPIPTGSGNGLSCNLLGVEDGFDVIAATLNAVKGQEMRVDLFSLTQGSKRSLSFMSQAVGLMAELDIGTENLRWMGETRFLYGLLRGLIKYKPCPVQLSFKVAETDKNKMAETVRSEKKLISPMTPISPNSTWSSGYVGDSLPPLKYLQDDEDGWTTFNEPIVYIYAGKGPYVGRDFMAFPVSLPTDGLIDVMALCKCSRSDILQMISGGAKEGESFWHRSVHYVKAHAYRIKPLKSKGYLSVDGEAYPFEEYQVEVHQGLGTFLSPYGHYAANFGPQKQKNP